MLIVYADDRSPAIMVPSNMSNSNSNSGRDTSPHISPRGLPWSASPATSPQLSPRGSATTPMAQTGTTTAPATATHTSAPAPQQNSLRNSLVWVAVKPQTLTPEGSSIVCDRSSMHRSVSPSRGHTAPLDMLALTAPSPVPTLPLHVHVTAPASAPSSPLPVRASTPKSPPVHVPVPIRASEPRPTPLTDDNERRETDDVAAADCSVELTEQLAADIEHALELAQQTAPHTPFSTTPRTTADAMDALKLHSPPALTSPSALTPYALTPRNPADSISPRSDALASPTSHSSLLPISPRTQSDATHNEAPPVAFSFNKDFFKAAKP